MNTEKTPDTLKKVLVFGDWFIDDYWVIGPHRSSTASRTGRGLYRVLQPFQSSVQSFCGAGRPASILCRARSGNEQVFEVHGVGVWHPGDTEDLKAMLEPTQSDRYNLHTLERAKASTGSCLNANLYCLPVDTENNNKAGTTRVIRLYQRFGDKAEVLERIDWVLETPVDQCHQRAWFSKDPTVKKLNRWAKKSGLPEKVDAVLVKDMRYGAVSPVTMQWLAERYAKAEWFISSKAWLPTWLEAIRNVRLRLFLVPQASAQTPFVRGEISHWITEREPSQEALRLLGKLVQKLSYKEGQHRLIVVLPCDESILALAAPSDAKKDWELMVQYKERPRDHKAPLPMASVFFPALAAHLIGHHAADPLNALMRTLAFTLKWREHEAGRLGLDDDWNPAGEPRIYLPPQEKEEEAGEWTDGLRWVEAKTSWERAFSLSALMKSSSTNPRRLQLWRTMTELKGYVCCVDTKRTVVRKLLGEVTRFTDARGERPVSAMLIASPGEGKTHLIRMLANECKLQFASCNLTQMVSRSDLIEFFDKIVTLQTQDRDQPVLAFVDEINAGLDGQPVYDAFLTPLEEGVYMRASRVMHIAPCAWVFAGTAVPAKSIKASDFLSRLTLHPVCELRTDKTDEKDTQQARIERVYLGVALLRESFPDVRFISDKVLRLLANQMFDGLGVRQLKHFVKSFADIQYAKALWRNVPREWLRSFFSKRFSETKWEKEVEDESNLFEIEVTPPF